MLKPPPRVVILSTAHGYGSGAESVLAELLRGRPRGGEVSWILLSPPSARPSEAALSAGTHLVALRTDRDALVPNLFQSLREVPQLRSADLIHAWHSRGFELAVILGRLLGIPATATVHDHPDCLTNRAGRRRIMRAAARRLDAVSFVSRAVANAWQGQLLPTYQTTVHNGLVDHLRARRPNSRTRIGFLGMNGPRKGFDLVAGWVGAAIGSNARWQFYGDIHESLTPGARQLTATFGDAVQFRGRQPATQIFDEIDILIHASTEFDSFPTVLLEAARAGIPAVAASAGGSAEILVHGTTGYVFDPSTPDVGLRFLMDLAANATGREEMGRAARARYESRFKVQRMVEGYSEFWDRVHRDHQARGR